MSQSTNQSANYPVDELGVPPAVQPQPLGAKIEVTDGNIRALDPTPSTTEVDTDTYIVQVTGDLSDALIKRDRKRIILVFTSTSRLVKSILLGTNPVSREGHPSNQKKVLPAMQAIFKAVPQIQGDARFALRGLALDAAQGVVDFVQDITSLRDELTPFVDDLDSAAAVGENYLDRFARAFDQRVAPLAALDSLIGRILKPLDDLIRAAAQKGIETKHVKDKAASDAVNKLPKEPTPVTPAPTPVISVGLPGASGSPTAPATTPVTAKAPAPAPKARRKKTTG